jgi:hypothetical protein
MSNRDAPHTLTVNHDREARRILLDPLTFTSARPLTTSADGLGYSFVLVCQDPPEHGRLRASAIRMNTFGDFGRCGCC